jgi:hypothetical protein
MITDSVGTVSHSWKTGISNNQLFVNATGVGIGTSSPGRTLHVNSTFFNTARFQSSQGNSRIEFQDADTSNFDSVSIGSDGDDFLINTGNGDRRVTVKDDGNVGIGTVSPNQQLEVKGSTKGVIRLTDGDTNAYTDIQQDFQTTQIINNGTGSIRFSTNGGEKVRINSDGKVGIGTSSPARPLTIVGTINIIRQGIDSTQYAERYYSGGANYQTARNGSSQGKFIWASTDGTTSIERMRIEASGNVGIGSSSPANKLEVKGGGIAINNAGSDHGTYGAIFSDSSGNLNLAGFNINLNTGSNNNRTTRVAVDEYGNVGIGTSSPQGKLHIESAATTAGWQFRTDSFGLNNESGFYRDASDNYELVLRNGAGGLSYLKNDGGASTANLSFNVQGSERLRIDSSGVTTIKNGAVAEIDTLYSAATITPDFAASCNFTLTLGQNLTIANPSNLTAGQSGSIFLIQDGTGSRTSAFGSYWDFVGGTAPTLSTAAGSVDRLDYFVRSSTSIHAVVTLAYS